MPPPFDRGSKPKRADSTDCRAGAYSFGLGQLLGNLTEQRHLLS
jgi:hypothetical protein